MRRHFAIGLALASLASLPVMAQAQTVEQVVVGQPVMSSAGTTVVSTNCPPGSATCTQVLETTVAQPTTTVTTSSPSIPVQRYIQGPYILFHIVNPSGGPVTFNIPDYGVSHVVPGYSERTFYMDRDSVMSETVAYNVNDANGSVVASGTLHEPGVTNIASTSQQLNSIVNYSTAYTTPVDPEPVYNDSPAQQERPTGYTRGYW